MRELPEMSKCGLIVGYGSFSFASYRETANINLLAVHANANSQSSIVNRDALESGWIVFTQSLVAVVLLASGNSQVLISVIQAIVVGMVAFAWIVNIQSKNVFMHPKASLFAVAIENVANSIERLCAAIPLGIPLPLHQVLIAMRGNANNLSPRKWDFTIGCIKRHPQSFLSHASGLLEQPMPLLYLGGN